MTFKMVIVFELEGTSGYRELRAELESLGWSFHCGVLPLPRMCCWAEFEAVSAEEAEQAAEGSFMQALARTSRSHPRSITPLRLAFMAFPSSAVVRAA